MNSYAQRTLLMLLVTVAFAAPASAAGIAWENDIDRARKLAAQTKRLVLLHFYSDNCAPCRIVDRDVFPNSNVQRAIALGYVGVKIHATRSRSLTERFQVRGWPTDIILTPDGKEIGRTVTPQNPLDYVRLLDTVAAHVRVNQPAPTIASANNVRTPQSPNAPSGNAIPRYSLNGATSGPKPDVNWANAAPQPRQPQETAAPQQPAVQVNPFVRTPGQPPQPSAQNPPAPPQASRTRGTNPNHEAASSPTNRYAEGQSNRWRSPNANPAPPVYGEAGPQYTRQTPESAGPATGAQLPEQRYGAVAPAQRYGPNSPAARTRVDSTNNRPPATNLGRTTTPEQPQQQPRPQPQPPATSRHGSAPNVTAPAPSRYGVAAPSTGDTHYGPQSPPTRYAGPPANNQPERGASRYGSTTQPPAATPTPSRYGTTQPQPASTQPQYGAPQPQYVAPQTRQNDYSATPNLYAPRRTQNPAPPQDAATPFQPRGGQAAGPAGPTSQPQNPGPSANAPVALDGFCPVILKFQRAWVTGDPRFAVVHHNRTYHCAGPREMAEFRANPDKYAPKLSGYDPVVFLHTKQLIDGNRNFGVWLESGEMYMFRDLLTLKEFERNPHQYINNVRQAMGAAGTQRR